jgi:hypothetical protein
MPTTREFLSAMDLDQIEFARSECERLIAAKLAESSVPLWVVGDADLNCAAFPIEQHAAAVARLVREIQEYAERFPGEEIRLGIKRRLFRASEVPEMLGL